MSKKNFLTLVFGVIGGLLFSLGMCMCLLPEWNMFQQGKIITAIGLVALLVLYVIRWVADGRKMVKPNWKLIGKIVYGTVSTLVLGVGMCLIMVSGVMLQGIIVGIVGIVMLLGMIPMCVGLK